jgi:hypothetical protein
VMSNSLTAEVVRKFLCYDPLTGILTWKISPSRNCRLGAVAGCQMQRGYLTIGLLRKLYLAHRLAWLIVYGKWPDQAVDHIDGDRTNNRLANLREATNSQNQQNRLRKGYHFKDGLYCARITLNEKRIALGYFKTEEAARAAYLEASEKHFGEFSVVHRGGRLDALTSEPSAASSPGAQ